MTLIDWLLLALYLGGILALGVFLSKKQEDEDSFFLGNRNLPWFAVTISIVATSLSAGSFVGLPQVSYTRDLTFIMIPMGSTLGGILAAVFIVRALYRANTLTIYGYLRTRYGPSAEIAASWVFLVGVLLAQGARHFIASIVVALMLFGSSDMTYLIASIVLLGVVATIYTAMGGIHAVIWTDVIQTVTLVIAAVICLFSLYAAIPLDLGEIAEALRTDASGNKLRWWNGSFSIEDPYTAWSAIGAYALVNVAQYGCDQDMVQRMMTCKSESRAMWSMILSRVVSVPIVLLFLAIGLLLYLFYARPDVMGAALPSDVVSDTGNVLPQYILAHLPPGIVGLAVAGVLAASMSSFDSAANAMASSVQGNLRKQNRISTQEHPLQDKALSLLQSRRTVYWMGAGLTVFAILAAILQQAGGQRLIDFSLGVLTFAYSGLLGVFVAALFTPRGNERSAVWALVAGGLVVLAFQPFLLPYWSRLLWGEPIAVAWPWWMVLGGTTSFLVCFSGKPNRPSPHAEPVA